MLETRALMLQRRRYGLRSLIGSTSVDGGDTVAAAAGAGAVAVVGVCGAGAWRCSLRGAG